MSSQVKNNVLLLLSPPYVHILANKPNLLKGVSIVSIDSDYYKYTANDRLESLIDKAVDNLINNLNEITLERFDTILTLGGVPTSRGERLSDQEILSVLPGLSTSNSNAAIEYLVLRNQDYDFFEERNKAMAASIKNQVGNGYVSFGASHRQGVLKNLGVQQ